MSKYLFEKKKKELRIRIRDPPQSGTYRVAGKALRVESHHHHHPLSNLR